MAIRLTIRGWVTLAHEDKCVSKMCGRVGVCRHVLVLCVFFVRVGMCDIAPSVSSLCSHYAQF